MGDVQRQRRHQRPEVPSSPGSTIPYISTGHGVAGTEGDRHPTLVPGMVERVHREIGPGTWRSKYS